MDLSQVSWLVSCVSRMHKCPMLHMFPHHALTTLCLTMLHILCLLAIYVLIITMSIIIVYCTHDTPTDGVSTQVMPHRPSCVMDLSQASWQGSCASGTHKCPTLSMFPCYSHIPHCPLPLLDVAGRDQLVWVLYIYHHYC
jgi:hypothetical protein